MFQIVNVITPIASVLERPLWVIIAHLHRHYLSGCSRVLSGHSIKSSQDTQQLSRRRDAGLESRCDSTTSQA